MTPLLISALLGCPKAPPGITADTLQAAPQLPSPEAGTYARVPSAPTDPVIAALLTSEHRWDASLSGAAAGIALVATRNGSEALTRWRVREALWTSGYAWPVHSAKLWSTPHEAPPPGLLRAWLSERGPDEDIGLVRARGNHEDHWVALASKPRVKLDALPRRLDQGTLLLPANPGATWMVSDPVGGLDQGDLAEGTRIPLLHAGEWLIQVSDGQGLAASVTVYVSVELPEDTLLEPSPPVSTAAEALEETGLQLERVRQAWDVGPLQRDPMLDAAATSWLELPDRDTVRLTDGLGFSETSAWRCEAETVQDCLDQVVWEPAHRAALLQPGHSALGVAAKVEQTVVLVGILGTPLED